MKNKKDGKDGKEERVLKKKKKKKRISFRCARSEMINTTRRRCVFSFSDKDSFSIIYVACAMNNKGIR